MEKVMVNEYIEKIAKAIAEGMNQAMREGINANTITINAKYKLIKSFFVGKANGEIIKFPPTLFGKDVAFSSFPEKLNDMDFAISRVEETETEKRVREINRAYAQSVIEYCESLSYEIHSGAGRFAGLTSIDLIEKLIDTIIDFLLEAE